MPCSFGVMGKGSSLETTWTASTFGQVHFIAARRARIFANLAGDLDRRFVGEAVCGRKDFRSHRVLHQDALDVAGAVSNHEELNLAAGAFVVEPAAERDFLSDVFAGVFNVDSRHSSSSCRDTGNLYFRRNSSMEFLASSIRSFRRLLQSDALSSRSSPAFQNQRAVEGLREPMRSTNAGQLRVPSNGHR